MPHNRTSIRQALATLLGGLTFPVEIEHPGTRIDAALRPRAILSLTDDAPNQDKWTMGSPKVEHGQTLLVELHADAASGLILNETIDAMELELEAALASDITLGGLCEMIQFAGSELEVNTDQTAPVGVRSVTYILEWRANFGAPDTPE